MRCCQQNAKMFINIQIPFAALASPALPRLLLHSKLLVFQLYFTRPAMFVNSRLRNRKKKWVKITQTIFGQNSQQKRNLRQTFSWQLKSKRM